MPNIFFLRKFHASKAEQDLNVFKKQRNFVVNLVNRTKAEYFKTTIEENRFHPKALWSAFKQILPGSKAELLSRVTSNDGESFHTTPLHSIHKGRLGVDLCDIMLLYSAATYVIVWLR